MGDLFQAAIVGAIQGATEFLPISSSGHLLLIRSLFVPYQKVLTLDVFFHFGSLLAIIYFFRRQFKPANIKNLIKPLIITTIPVAIIGFLIDHYSIPLFDSPRFLGLAFLITTLMLFSWPYIGKNKTKLNQVSSFQALEVGLFQAIAIFPGVSRSASTLVGSKFAGLKEQDSFQYAFLVAIPALLGALGLVLKDGISLNPALRTFGLVGLVSSFLVSLLALRLLKALVKSHKPHYFAWYTLILSAISFALFSS